MDGLGWKIEGPPEALNRGQFRLAADARRIVAAVNFCAGIPSTILEALSDEERSRFAAAVLTERSLPPESEPSMTVKAVKWFQRNIDVWSYFEGSPLEPILTTGEAQRLSEHLAGNLLQRENAVIHELVAVLDNCVDWSTLNEADFVVAGSDNLGRLRTALARAKEML